MTQKAFGDDAMRAAEIKVWHKHFKDGRESVENNPCSGRPATGLGGTQIGGGENR